MNGNLHTVTPLLQSKSLEILQGCQVFLKLENCQPSGSFKIRGIGNLSIHEKNSGKQMIVCSSGGNAGLAAAHAAAQLSLPCKIYVPGSTPQFTIENLRSKGAEVEVVGKIWDDANEAALAHVKTDPNCAFIHPFDHPLIWTGHGTLIHEIKEQMTPRKPDCIVTSVGGGGLAAGVLQGLDEVGWSDVPVVAVETEGADSLRASLDAGRVVFIPTITSIAKSLGSRSVCDRLFEYTKTHNIHSVVVTDKQAVDACLRFADDHRFMVEPACGASLAVLYNQILTSVLPDVKLDNVVVVVCGGNSVTLETLQAWKTQFSL